MDILSRELPPLGEWMDEENLLRHVEFREIANGSSIYHVTDIQRGGPEGKSEESTDCRIIKGEPFKIIKGEPIKF